MNGDPRLNGALELLRQLSVEIGSRRPCSDDERRAAEAIQRWLAVRGVDSRLQEFRGLPSGGPVYGAIFATALLGGLMARRRPLLGAALAGKALVLAGLEADLRWTPVSDLLARGQSANVVASVPAKHEAIERICLVGHMDSTRSGLVFHPAVIGHLEKLLGLPIASAAVLAAGPLIGRLPGATGARRLAIAGLIASVALIAERELRGEDVPGANDNASGTAVAAQLLAEVARDPLANLRVDMLVTGCEESGLLGAREYARTLDGEGPKTTFVNFDTVGASGVPLTYLLDDGYARPLPASPRLVGLLERIAAEHPGLRLEPSPGTPGLPTDATAALAHGYEAITLLAQARDGAIPNYHWPTDTYENVDQDLVGRTLETGRLLLAALDVAAAEGAKAGLLGNQ